MADIATVVLQNTQTGQQVLDWYLDGADLASDEGLSTAITLSLFSDAQAGEDDTLPSGDGDRRGWWGGEIGSLLWLLAGLPATPGTARQGKLYAEKSLKWLKDDGVVQSIKVASVWFDRDKLGLAITVSKQDATGQVVILQFNYVWSATLALARSTPVRDGSPLFVPQPIVITTESGSTLTTEDGRPLFS